MLEDLEIDDSGSPAIGLVPPGITWQQVRDHIKIAHLFPRDARRHQADRGHVAVIDLQVLEHGVSLGGLVRPWWGTRLARSG